MAAIKLKIARRTYAVGELVFKQLRAICDAYNVLANPDSPDAEKTSALSRIVQCLTGKPLRINRISTAEWQALFEAIPALCGFDAANAGSKSNSDSWGKVYAHLSACFGWDYDYIDEHMTLSRLKEYGGYLKDNPPTHQMVAAYLGVNTKGEDQGEAFLASMLYKAKQMALKKNQAENGAK